MDVFKLKVNDAIALPLTEKILNTIPNSSPPGINR